MDTLWFILVQPRSKVRVFISENDRKVLIINYTCMLLDQQARFCFSKGLRTFVVDSLVPSSSFKKKKGYEERSSVSYFMGRAMQVQRALGEAYGLNKLLKGLFEQE